MTITLQDFREDTRKHLGLELDESDMDNIEVDKIINRSYTELLAKYKFRAEECRATFPIVKDNVFISIPTDQDHIRMLSIEDPDDQSKVKLIKVSRERYIEELGSPTSRGKPVFYERENKGIKFAPVPDKAYTLEIIFNGVLSQLDELNTIPEMPQQWHEIILFGAIYRGFQGLGELKRAEFFRAQQTNIIAGLVETEGEESTDDIDAYTRPFPYNASRRY